MKFFEVAIITLNHTGTDVVDESPAYLGADVEEARAAYERSVSSYQAHLVTAEKKKTIVEARVYNIPDDVDLNDLMEISDAMCEAGGYDVVDDFGAFLNHPIFRPDQSAIRVARVEAGLTQRALSESLGIPKRTIEDWESGRRSCPDWCERLIVDKIREL